MTTNILACDPGRSSGYALFTDGRLTDSGHINVRTNKGALQLWTVVCSLNLQDAVMVIEGAHRMNPKMGWATLLGMGIPRGQWEQAARMRKIKIVEVKPNEWQLPTIGRGLRKQQIAKYTARAEQIAKRPVQADEAAAIVMGDWWIREQRRK